jgi:hypothetical protein
MKTNAWCVLFIPLLSLCCGGSGGSTVSEKSQDALVADTTAAESFYSKDIFSNDSPAADISADSSGYYEESYYYPKDTFKDAKMSDSGYVKETGECAPQCEGKQCGPDGCGGACGWCPGTQSCHDGKCIDVQGCYPQCTAKMVGEDDGCGGVCSGSGMSIGLKPGGAQDAGYFKKLVMDGEIPDPDLLPVEGWLNEHDTPLPPPDTSKLLTLHAFLGLFYDPQEAEPVITMQLGMNSGLDPKVIEEGTFNLSIVLDKSGSMSESGKIEFAKEGLKLMLDALDEKDILSIVVYDTTAEVFMEPTKVTDKEKIKAMIDTITPDGSTNLYDGMILGYEHVLKSMSTVPKAQHRTMLITDGLVNTGVTDQKKILEDSKKYNDEGVGITTIGVGKEFNLDLMYQLANQGSGNFYFLDSASKLSEVFEQEIKYLLTPVAKDLFMSFRLTDGFETEAIYGFQFKVLETGDVILLGPEPQKTVGPEEPPPENPPKVSISTVYASKKNGLLMVKIKGPEPDVIASFANLDFATVSYKYTVIKEKDVEASYENIVKLDGVHTLGEDKYEYFTDNIVRRNFCILRMALSMKQACTYYQDSQNKSQTEKEDLISKATAELSFADTFCKGVYFQLKLDGWTGQNLEVINDDLAVVNKLVSNICTEAKCKPAEE